MTGYHQPNFPQQPTWYSTALSPPLGRLSNSYSRILLIVLVPACPFRWASAIFHSLSTWRLAISSVYGGCLKEGEEKLRLEGDVGCGFGFRGGGLTDTLVAKASVAGAWSLTISISQASPPYPSPKPVHCIFLPGQSTISFSQASPPYPSPRPGHYIFLPGQSTISISQASPSYPFPRPVHHTLLPGQSTHLYLTSSIPAFFVLFCFFNKSKCDTQNEMDRKGSIPDFWKEWPQL